MNRPKTLRNQPFLSGQRCGYFLILLIILLIGVVDQTPAQKTVMFGNGKDKNKQPQSSNPVVVNPRFLDGMLKVDAGGSFIDMTKSTIKVDAETFPLNIDDSGTFFRVGRERISTPGKLKITEAIPHGREVTLVIVNADGKSSQPVRFKR